jgi:hypothetical protein
MSFNYLSPKACEASDGGRRHERRRRVFPRELILQGKARSDDTDKLGADFMAAPPHLSFPRIISARSDDAILTRSVW